MLFVGILIGCLQEKDRSPIWFGNVRKFMVFNYWFESAVFEGTYMILKFPKVHDLQQHHAAPKRYELLHHHPQGSRHNVVVFSNNVVVFSDDSCTYHKSHKKQQQNWSFSIDTSVFGPNKFGCYLATVAEHLRNSFGSPGSKRTRRFVLETIFSAEPMLRIPIS